VITTKTVLVLGAGASAPYKFPTGTELIQQMKEFSKQPDEDYIRTLPGPEGNTSKLLPLYRALDKDPPSVDTLLEYRPDLVATAKVVVACILLNAEKRSLQYLWQCNNDEHWYKYLLALLEPFTSLEKNQLKIITFNYDRSFQHYLFESIEPYYGDAPPEIRAKQVSNIPVIHIYGSLGPLPWETDKDSIPYGGIGVRRFPMCEASQNIKVWHEGSEHAVESNFTQAQQWLKEAQRILFLGFGFHEDNIYRLNLKEILPPKHKRTAATCWELDKTSMRRVEGSLSFPQPPAKCCKFLRGIDLS
jgi:hypothetical protein